MRWQNRAESNNVEDRRGVGRGKVAGGASAIVMLVVLVAGYYGIDLTPILNIAGIETSQQTTNAPVPSAKEQELAKFTSVALKTTEDTWQQIFRQAGRTYIPPKLVLYSGTTNTACGYGQSAMGPFYCPADRCVYIDLAFYNDMEKSLGGGGDFALGYVLAHEIGHHVQQLLGITAKTSQMQHSASKSEANRISVKVELQADCLAGVWGHAMQNERILEAGDLEEALSTATAIGDDRLQKRSTGRVVPDSFTHGTSQQRYRWFKRGFDSGNINQCNTFAE